ncbi:amino acid adenylation domain-containing protein [Streptomyces sp. NPDC049040]|uniref:amino acid adenylation domain-containing protein n=1 Tax=Streptomyces sp. NPDC049040 TaxID=3365593 RepID=UPI00370FF83B
MTGGTRVATSEQLDLWLAAGQDPESPRYNVPTALEFHARPDERAIREALHALSARHPALRSSFRLDASGQLHQKIPDAARLPLRVVRVQEEWDHQACAAWAAQVGLRPIALGAAGVARADLLLHREGAVLVLTVHHIAIDGWSVELAVDEFLALYDAAAAGQGPAPADAEEPEGSETADPENVAYWLDLLGREPETLEPIADLVRGTRPSRAARDEVTVEGAELAALRAMVERARVSMSTAGLAGWSVVLHQWSGLDEGLLATPFSARVDPGTHRTVGMLSRVLPIRSAYDPATPWSDHLDALHLQVLESFERSAVDTGVLRAALAASGRRYPAFRSVYTHLSEPGPLHVLPDTVVSRIDIDLGAVKYDLAAAVVEGPGKLVLQLEYDAGLYRPATVRAMLGQLRGLLSAAAADPGAALGDLLREADGDTAPTGTWDGTPADVSVPPPRLVVEAARSHPERTAVVHGERELTYAQLVAAAARVANWLLAADGDEPAPTVGVLMPGGIDAVVAFLGIALAGKAYVPMDPGHPAVRLAGIVEDAGIRRILTTADLAGGAARLGCTAHTLDEVSAAAEGDTPPDVPLTPDTLLNVLYTSGSTGRPKGVLLPHRGVARLMRNGGRLRIDENDRVAQLCPLNFDGATFEIWGALTQGARLVVLDRTVVLAPTELRDAVDRFGVTVLIITTPVLHSVVTEAPELLQSLTLLSLGGDTASVPHVARALAWCGPGVLVHTYGPTENSFTSVLAPIDHVDGDSRVLPLGRCVPGTEAYVVRAGTYDPAPVGAPGELLLGGLGLAAGYLGDPRRTAASFVPDPFSGRPGAVLYRTGDRVRRLPGGELEFLGRTDDQLKIRSQRIELGEVRSALLADEAVREGHVAGLRNARDEKEIAAYVVLAPGATPAQVRDRLARVLPAAALPTRWARVDALPLNANGKVDPGRLPLPALLGADTADGTDAGGASAPTPSRAAATPGALDAVRAAWREVLDDAPPGDDVNFFDAGGHSLLLARLQSALRRHAGAEIRVSDLFRFPSIRAQAEFLAASGDGPRAAEAPAAAAGEPIAVIGAAGRFAGAADVRAFWRNLSADCVAGAQEEIVEVGGGRRRIARWGRLDAPRAFDAELFGLTPDEARVTDPQHGMLHECLWSAMEDAAVTLDRLRDRTSIYVGCANPAQPAATAGLEEDLTAAFMSQPSFAASRYAYRHDLRGESVMVDTACSTSLVAVHLACASLRSGGSDYAFAGGVSVADPADGGYVYEPGMIYADDGVCRPFDEAATGTVGGDGAGVVLLRRLSDALRDGDPVHAVILGSAVNNDGRARAGYAAPGFDGQVSVIRRALASARVEGRDIGFVETHGTGTRLGDAVEAAALAEAVGARDAPLPISSVKASIGHCNTAAGIAGLLKAVHAVRDHVLPGTANSVTPIEEIASGDRLRLLTQTETWAGTGRARLAGVSSFGVGGTNAHVVVGEFTERDDSLQRAEAGR